MARDKKKYYYPQPGIPRTQVLTHLQEEARERGVPLSTHLIDLLVDRDNALYGAGGQNIWFPRGVPVQQMQASAPTSAEPDIRANLDAFSQFLDDEDDMPQPNGFGEHVLPVLPATEGRQGC